MARRVKRKGIDPLLSRFMIICYGAYGRVKVGNSKAFAAYSFVWLDNYDAQRSLRMTIKYANSIAEDSYRMLQIYDRSTNTKIFSKRGLI